VEWNYRAFPVSGAVISCCFLVVNRGRPYRTKDDQLNTGDSPVRGTVRDWGSSSHLDVRGDRGVG